jgi:RNA polymerase sigma factor (sigma-70 family)
MKESKKKKEDSKSHFAKVYGTAQGKGETDNLAFLIIDRAFEEVTQEVKIILREGLKAIQRQDVQRLISERNEEKTFRQRIEDVLESLTYREREIIKLRYGIGNGYTYSIEDVGKIFKVTRERVRQIEAKAIRKLQHPVRTRKLEGFLDGFQQG